MCELRSRIRALFLSTLLLPALAVPGPLLEAQEEDPGRDPSRGVPAIVAEDLFPLRGEATAIRLEGPDGGPLVGVALRARYRPNSETAHTAEIGTTGADGRVAWTPADAGVVLLEAGAADAPLAQTRVSVRFGGFPPVGLLVMVMAALLLFGGAATGFTWLLSTPRQVPAEEPPST